MTRVIQPQSRVRFGLAQGDITPPAGIYHRMWGAATHDRSTGIHRPLAACAVALQPESQQEPPLFLIAVDHCLLREKEMNDLLTTVSGAAEVPRDRLLVAFSHTHAAGLMEESRGQLPGGELIAPYLKEVAQTVAKLVRAARGQLEPALISYGKGRCDLARQRDFWDEGSKQWVCGYNPAGASDDTVLVARVASKTGKTLATLVNYACHPTTLAWENTLVSPDYVGALREVVEGATQAPCVFLQGASGDLGPRHGFVGDVGVAERNGRQLAHAVLSTLEGLDPPGTAFEFAGPVVSGATLGPWRHVPVSAEVQARQASWRCQLWNLDLPYRPGLPNVEQTKADRARWVAAEEAAKARGETIQARDARAMIERADRLLTRLGELPPGKTFPLPLMLWQMGDACWLAAGGEYYQLLQTALRERFPTRPIMVVTLVNGWCPTYLPTRDSYDTGIYQESIAILAAGCLEQVIESVGEQLAVWGAEKARVSLD
ncbi:MAG: neutral/alkaline non-lysosomal ceramidase N-terminal domain-containing protein [Gemmataceae bacterium]